MEEHHEAIVHVVLLVAVEEGVAGVVGGELDVDLLIGGDEDDVFKDAGGVGAAEAAKFEDVAMEMDGGGRQCCD